MEIIREIGLQVIEILTLIFGTLGLAFSAMLMFAPNLTRKLSNILNRNVNVEQNMRFLDKDIAMSAFFYSHHVVVGLLLMAGSALALFFIYFSMDSTNFSKIFPGSPQQVFFGEILLDSILWVGKAACVAGLIFGGMLTASPEKMKRVENKLDSWFETGSVIEKLDQSNPNVDSFFFRHPLPVGMVGAIISFMILSLSIIHLLD
jgi:hypothetical protein